MIDGGGPDAYPCEMREGRILMYDNATCIAMVRKHTSLRKEYAFTNAICAGYKTGGVDSCSVKTKKHIYSTIKHKQNIYL